MDFRLGLVEGFYGREWSWAARQQNLQFLAGQHFSEYLYAPKADVFLRKRWYEHWPDDVSRNIEELLNEASSCDIVFSLGISPLGFFSGNVSNPMECLIARLERFQQMGIQRVYLLFDDMRGDDPALAEKQAGLVNEVLTAFPGLAIGMCPSYYSDDPVLDKVFGQRPENYLEQLGDLLAPEAEVFWTGEKVCSESYSLSHIKRVGEQLQRKPLLWDNYPVNDGKHMCGKLHLKPFTGRPPQMQSLLSGHMANPMNQPLLSRLPLASLGDNYFPQPNRPFGLQNALWFDGNNIEASLLERDIQLFSEKGLEGISPVDVERLQKEYQNANGRYADEVFDWLSGGYAFDPDCLT